MPLSWTRPPSHAPRTPRPPGACIFCDIVAGRQPATILADEAVSAGGPRLVAFADHRPAARAHVLVVPADAHIDSVYDLEGDGDVALLNDMVSLGARVAAAAGADGDGAPPRLKLGFHYPPTYSVPHLHLHAFALPHTGPMAALRFKESGGDRPSLWFARPDQVAARVRARAWEEAEKQARR